MSIDKEQLMITPGPCRINSVTGLPACPPTTEIDVISVIKVFSEGFDTVDEEMEIPFDAPTLEIITGNAQTAECVSAEVNLINSFAIDENHIRIICSFDMTSRVPLDDGGYEYSSATKTITKVLCLAGASVEGLVLESDFYPKCLHSVISERDDLGNVTGVTSFAEICMLVKQVGLVQILIPTYGAYQPPRCSLAIPCPVAPPSKTN